MPPKNAQSETMPATRVSELCFPRKWETLPESLKTRIVDIDARLRAQLGKLQPTYSMLSEFGFEPGPCAQIREEIREVVARRRPFGHSMTQEMATIERATQLGLFSSEKTLYQCASDIRFLLFGQHEPLRKFNVTITYLPWLRMVPPKSGDPVFSLLSDFCDGPAIHEALNIYLILLSGHVFSDGNGRTARIAFNLYLMGRYGADTGHLPISELCRAGKGLYEELLARAHYDGNYEAVMDHMLDVLDSYATFVEQRQAGCANTAEPDDIEKIQALLRKNREQPDDYHFDLNRAPPYAVSINHIASIGHARKLNTVFIEESKRVAEQLRDFGELSFAMTNLHSITRPESKNSSIVYFVKTVRKEDLVLRSREIRANHVGIEEIEFALITGDASLDAKILIGVSNAFQREVIEADDCTLLLHDFDTLI